ncbi:hypothetical protein PHLGIDRAFT_350265 [Phlebiopsis gigantea 11061_1 CR5-6]|uniref:Microbial-type PARG catalytic domain-containing protein n=1 Tax=Phlebiopsis gigantea (strain 11061_1 CR5-6) TaxID=745531 RepID=A0A0C3SA85_PHLG1|nr:hypothetical protein PHLGIDRAFT_350265 [Phlebiopsis gigantea 11061_1 CR5-6]
MQLTLKEAGMSQSRDNKPKDDRKNILRDIAASTISAIEHGSYLQHDIKHDIAVSRQGTRYYAPNSLLSTWASAERPQQIPAQTSLFEISTLEGIRFLAEQHAGQDTPPKIGVLNFASAKKPGGGFLNGAQAQEESIARSSTLYPTLMTAIAQAFYTLHNRDPKGGYYSHAMVYSPNVVVFRDDQGGWLAPLRVDVLTSPAVNAGVVRRALKDGADAQSEEEKIRRTMKERMGRVLYLFESQGVKNLVLGSFGTGVFQNDVSTVASLWAELLLEDGSRFQKSFDHVVFAVLGKKTFEDFETVFSLIHSSQTRAQ